VVEDLARRLAERPEVAGVAILGGLARGGSRQFVDRSSDLDLAVFLSLPLPPEILALPPQQFLGAVGGWLPSWLPNFKFVVPPEASGLDWGVPVDNHQHVLEYEEQPHVPWDMAKVEAFAETAEIMHDPTGRLSRLIASRVDAARGDLDEALLRLFAYGRVLVDTAVEQLIARDQYEAAHDQLNELLRDVVAGWFAMSGRFPPVIKWRMASLDSLPWLPIDAAVRYRDMLVVRTHDAADVRRRRDGIRALMDEMEARCAAVRPGWPPDAYAYAVHAVFRDRQLAAVTAADRLAAVAGLGQNRKMEVAAWNWVNWTLST
jgi:hypothetical protein